MSTTVAESYAHCTRLARAAASNFYYAFYLLPRAKREAMCSLYAFMRRTDDLGDSDDPLATRRKQLEQWEQSLSASLKGDFRDPLLPALVDTIRKFEIPPELLFAVVRGVEMDLDQRAFKTQEELTDYCHHVASVVGLACVHIWGYTDPRALALAETCGQAFQLTNILRDLREDALHDRIYLPSDDLARFNYTPTDLRAGKADDRFLRLMAFEVSRAAEAYHAAAPLYLYLHRDGQRVFAALCGTYYQLLQKIYAAAGISLQKRLSLSCWEKTRIACTSAFVPRWCMSSEIGPRSARLKSVALQKSMEKGLAG
jgi:15-cis-phytoene synthase